MGSKGVSDPGVINPHVPVMLRQVIEFLNPHEGGVYVDATVGLAGHSEEILRHIGEGGRLIGTDRDEETLMEARQRLSDKRLQLKRARFSEINEVLAGIKADGILFDFGFSMWQLKHSGRGFSFLKDEPLDMRMDKAQALRADDIVNHYTEKELRRILIEYGQERFSSRIARKIIQSRPLRTSGELAQVIESAIGRRGRIHPATKTFQALRIAVNNELEEIEKGVGSAIGMLRQGGRLVVISYHSLEDRIVKNLMKSAQGKGLMRVLTKKPLTPDEGEIKANPPARSAKLRAGEAL